LYFRQPLLFHTPLCQCTRSPLPLRHHRTVYCPFQCAADIHFSRIKKTSFRMHWLFNAEC
jgi:hypothetical protein